MSDLKDNTSKVWCDREAEIFMEKSNADDYAKLCLDSAIKAYKSLLGDGHSGYSINVTKDFLLRLIDNMPLTPIEETDNWMKLPETFNKRGAIECYQSTRYTSLFKNVYSDGSIVYNDTNRAICVDINNPNATYSSGLVSRILNDIFPITLPYYPISKKFKIYCEDFLSVKVPGVHNDFDTVGIFYVITPIGDKININRFFKEKDDSMEEISLIEYTNRKKNYTERINKNS